MGGAGSSESEQVIAHSVQDLNTDTQNVGAQYAFLNFEHKSSQALILVLAILTAAVAGFLIFKRRCAKRKKKREVGPQSRAEDPPQPPSAPIPALGPAPPYYRWPQYQSLPIPAYNPDLNYPMARFDQPSSKGRTCQRRRKGNTSVSCQTDLQP